MLPSLPTIIMPPITQIVLSLMAVLAGGISLVLNAPMFN